MLTLRPVQWIQLINTFRNNMGIEALSHCGSRGGVRSFPVPLEEPYFPTSSSLQHNFLPNCLFIAYFYPSLFNSHPFVLINYLCLCFYPCLSDDLSDSDSCGRMSEEEVANVRKQLDSYF